MTISKRRLSFSFLVITYIKRFIKICLTNSPAGVNLVAATCVLEQYFTVFWHCVTLATSSEIKSALNKSYYIPAFRIHHIFKAVIIFKSPDIILD